MELLSTTLLGRPLRLEGNMAGWQQLYWDGQLVSQQAASEAGAEGTFEHDFELQSAEGTIDCRLQLELTWQPFKVRYQTSVNGMPQGSGVHDQDALMRSAPEQPLPVKRSFNLMGLLSLGFKLMKSAKVIKVLFAGASLAAYSWFFSFEFALTLIACLVFHEYGHIRAMKYFGMKTKGIYLIPFVGGLAVGENNINTRWQDVVISIMGPTFGLLMSLAALLAYWITGEAFFAGVAAFNALINLFNLLPVLPLDGGHVLKSIAFSMHSVVGLVVCIAGALVGVFVSYTFGLALLGFLLIIGTLEISLEWKQRKYSALFPLDRYGQVVSAVWYVAVVSAFVAIIIGLASSGDELLALPAMILNS